MNAIVEKSFIPGASAGPINITAADVAEYRSLESIGISFDSSDINQMSSFRSGVAMDAAPIPGLSTPSMSTPIQFLQAWLPGLVHTITQARKIDELVGVVTQGAWHDEEIVQASLEHTGRATPYGDYTNVAAVILEPNLRAPNDRSL